MNVWKVLIFAIASIMVSHIIDVQTSAYQPASDMIGIEPALRAHLNSVEKGMIGDLQYSSLGSATSSTATINAGISADGTYTRYIRVDLDDSNGVPHYWYSADVSATVTYTSASGVVAVTSPVNFIGGKGALKLVYTGSWANTDSLTVTLNSTSIMGYTVATATHVDNLTD